jgi:hypothetical protein
MPRHTGGISPEAPARRDIPQKWAACGHRRCWRIDIVHPPWQFQPAAASLGLDLGGAPMCHYAARQHVLCWPPVPG